MRSIGASVLGLGAFGAGHGALVGGIPYAISSAWKSPLRGRARLLAAGTELRSGGLAMGAVMGMLGVAGSLVDIGADYAGLQLESTEGYWVWVLLPMVLTVPVATRCPQWVTSKIAAGPFLSAAFLANMSVAVTLGLNSRQR
ncbi:hypothetical protein B0H11DRAFT_2277699, partial [Mycena galericulata]